MQWADYDCGRYRFIGMIMGDRGACRIKCVPRSAAVKLTGNKTLVVIVHPSNAIQSEAMD